MAIMRANAKDSKERIDHFFVSADEWFYSNHVHHDGDLAAHDHNYLELAFVLSGRARHVAVSGQEMCRAGDMLIIPVGAWHSYVQAAKLEVVNCLISPSMLQNELSWLAADARLSQVLGLAAPFTLTGQPSRWKVTPAQMKKIRPRLSELLESYEGGASRLELLGHLLLLLAQVRAVVGKASALRGQAAGTASASSAAAGLAAIQGRALHLSVERGLLLLSSDLSRSWTLSELAERLRLNPSYLVRLFRTQTGLPPMKYLDRLRANRAATLLFAQDLSIARIGEQVGWADPKQFSRQFRQHFGQSATRYRESLLGGGATGLRSERSRRQLIND